MGNGEFGRVDMQFFRAFSSCDGGVVAVLGVVSEQHLYIRTGYALFFVNAVLFFLPIRMQHGCQQRKREIFVLHAMLVAAAASAGFSIAAAAGAFAVSVYAIVEFLYVGLTRPHGGVIQIGPLVWFYRRAAIKKAGGSQ